jgi:hypothetical protein
MASSFFMSLDSIKAFHNFEIFQLFGYYGIQSSHRIRTICRRTTALNSNLFPVNAKGEVLFLSVLSKGHLDFTYNVQLQVGFPLEIIFQQ